MDSSQDNVKNGNQVPFASVFTNQFDRLTYKYGPTKHSWIPYVQSWRCIYALPYSWEVGYLPTGGIYFINHSQKSTSNFYPNELLYSPQIRSNSLSNEENISSSLNQFEATLLFDSTINNYGINVINESLPQISIIHNNSSTSFFKNDDQIVSINGISQDNPREFLEIMNEINNPKLKMPMTILYQRTGRPSHVKNDLNDVHEQATLKSAFLSKETMNKRLRCPVKVHFADRPLILLKPASIRTKKLINSDDYYSCKIQVTFETGITHSQIFEANTTVKEYITNVVLKHSFGIPDYYSLARYDQNHMIKEVYGHDMWLRDIWNSKSSSPCNLIISHIPNNINQWRQINYRRISFYLFSQSLGNIKLRTGLPTLINNEIMVKIAALIVAHEYLLRLQSGCVKIVKRGSVRKSLIGSLRRSIKDRKSVQQNSIDSSFDKPDNPYKVDLRKFSKEEILDEFDNWSTIFSSRRDLEKLEVVQAIYQLMYEIGEKNGLCEQRFSLSSSQIDDIIHQIQIDFLELAINYNIIGLYTFRVHDCTSDFRRIGVPVTLILSSVNGLGLENDSKFLSVCSFSKIIAIVISYNIDGRYLINFFIEEEKFFSLITNKAAAYCIVQLIMQQSLNLQTILIDDNDESIQTNIILFDLTDYNKRTKISDVPSYSACNHVLPSFWSYSVSSIFSFFSSWKIYQSLMDKCNLTPSQIEVKKNLQDSLFVNWSIPNGFNDIQSFISMNNSSSSSSSSITNLSRRTYSQTKTNNEDSSKFLKHNINLKAVDINFTMNSQFISQSYADNHDKPSNINRNNEEHISD